MSIRIIGAGMAGLLAAEMLRRDQPVIDEAQPSLPDNHGALLRFRSDAVARETRQPFLKVSVLKAVKSGGRLRPVSTLRDANEYALKVSGVVSPRSVLDLAACTRYVAPPTFLNVLARDARVRLNNPLQQINLAQLRGQKEVAVISTIPMPVLMSLAEWSPRPEFGWRPIWSVTTTILAPAINVYQTIYYPAPDVPYYRASITGNRLTIEFTREPGHRGHEWELSDILADFGLPTAWGDRTELVTKRQEYGKLTPIPQKDRHEFIMAMTDEYNIYSVGRFATWRQILLDDVVADIHLVTEMIAQRSGYQQRLRSTS